MQETALAAVGPKKKTYAAREPLIGCLAAKRHGHDTPKPIKVKRLSWHEEWIGIDTDAVRVAVGAYVFQYAHLRGDFRSNSL
jgi:hypothetical protein